MSARILVVDDMAANAGLLAAKLGAEYYDVAIAAGGQQALALAAEWQPDMVMLDVMMPGLDGYEVCRRLKADQRTVHVPVVMFTGLESAQERVRGLDAGADDFLCKPIDYEMLLAQARSLVRLKRQLDGWRARGQAARERGLAEGPQPHELAAGGTVLMITDGNDYVAPVRAALGLDRLSVATARGLDAGLERCGRSLPDAIMIDLALRGGDPLAVVSGLQTNPLTRPVPLILIAEPGHRARCLKGFDIGAHDWVRAPIEPSELRARVRNQIKRKNYQTWLRDDLGQALDLAITDELTGLYNQRYLRRCLRRPAPAGDGKPVAALMIDIDHFKAVNDRYGHPKGDEVLRRFARVLRHESRACDIVARYGGEEFVLLMRDAGIEEAMAAAERLRSAVASAPYEPYPGVKHRITVSIGVATADLAEQDADELLNRADQALYVAKNAGRNRVQLALPEQCELA